MWRSSGPVALPLEITVISILKKQLVRYLLKENAIKRTKFWGVLECGDLFIMFMFYILYTHKVLETGSKVKKASVRPSTVLNYLWMSLLVCKIWSYFWRLFENLPYNLCSGVTVTKNVWMLITLDEWFFLDPLYFLLLPHIPPLYCCINILLWTIIFDPVGQFDFCSNTEIRMYIPQTLTKNLNKHEKQDVKQHQR